MYHISSDKRSVRSAESIYGGLLRCLEKKPFEQITVTDVQRASGVARTTIYRSFDNLADILYWRCDIAFKEALGCSSEGTAVSEWQLIRNYFEYWTGHSDILKLLVDINRQDIIFACHMKNAQALEQAHGTLEWLSAADAKYFVAIRTGVTVSVLKVWLDGGRKEPADELVEILKRQISVLFGEIA